MYVPVSDDSCFVKGYTRLYSKARQHTFFIMYPIVECTTTRKTVYNNCIRCAERNLIKFLSLEASRQGVHPWCFSRWVHRKYGTFTVRRVLVNGSLGTSLPCVMCRKSMERLSIQWKAHIGQQWVRSTDEIVPRSRPTTRQIRELNFKSK